MKKRNKLIYILIAILFLVIVVSEYKDYKQDQFQDCMIEYTQVRNFETAKELCEDKLN